jgi:hypothetical protein
MGSEVAWDDEDRNWVNISDIEEEDAVETEIDDSGDGSLSNSSSENNEEGNISFESISNVSD